MVTTVTLIRMVNLHFECIILEIRRILFKYFHQDYYPQSRFPFLVVLNKLDNIIYNIYIYIYIYISPRNNKGLPRWHQWQRTCLPMQVRCKRGEFHPGSGRSPGGGNSSPLQYSCLENPIDRGAWWTAVLTVTQSQTQLK